ncbi:MAG: hypothetical protein GY862_19945 [Gammaproteobacteria bacterium]|nr:hypothetical protein [Gammaproteobacteria bacterium]
MNTHNQQNQRAGEQSDTINKRLAKEAGKRGTTPELLAIDCLRRFFIPKPKAGKPNEDETLFDFLSGCTGTINGTAEALSENCGQRFARGLIEKQR